MNVTAVERETFHEMFVCLIARDAGVHPSEVTPDWIRERRRELYSNLDFWPDRDERGLRIIPPTLVPAITSLIETLQERIERKLLAAK